MQRRSKRSHFGVIKASGFLREDYVVARLRLRVPDGYSKMVESRSSEVILGEG
jgi:hypothetical protein